jgi:hypothetical protein
MVRVNLNTSNRERLEFALVVECNGVVSGKIEALLDFFDAEKDGFQSEAAANLAVAAVAEKRKSRDKLTPQVTWSLPSRGPLTAVERASLRANRNKRMQGGLRVTRVSDPLGSHLVEKPLHIGLGDVASSRAWLGVGNVEEFVSRNRLNANSDSPCGRVFGCHLGRCNDGCWVSASFQDDVCVHATCQAGRLFSESPGVCCDNGNLELTPWLPWPEIDPLHFEIITGRHDTFSKPVFKHFREFQQAFSFGMAPYFSDTGPERTRLRSESRPFDSHNDHPSRRDPTAVAGGFAIFHGLDVRVSMPGFASSGVGSRMSQLHALPVNEQIAHRSHRIRELLLFHAAEGDARDFLVPVQAAMAELTSALRRYPRAAELQNTYQLVRNRHVSGQMDSAHGLQLLGPTSIPKTSDHPRRFDRPDEDNFVYVLEPDPLAVNAAELERLPFFRAVAPDKWVPIELVDPLFEALHFPLLNPNHEGGWCLNNGEDGSNGVSLLTYLRARLYRRPLKRDGLVAVYLNVRTATYYCKECNPTWPCELCVAFRNQIIDKFGTQAKLWPSVEDEQLFSSGGLFSIWLCTSFSRYLFLHLEKVKNSYGKRLDLFDRTTSVEKAKVALHKRRRGANGALPALSSNGTVPNVPIAEGIGRPPLMHRDVEGSQESYLQTLDDVFAVCAKTGRWADLFITVNADEKILSNKSFQEGLPYPASDPSHAPLKGQPQRQQFDLASRLFAHSVRMLEACVLDGQAFGKWIDWLRVIEYQRCDLPHLHALLTLKERLSLENVSDFVTVELPDPTLDADLYDLVLRYQIHICNEKCLVDGVCNKDCLNPECNAPFIGQGGRLFLPSDHTRKASVMYERKEYEISSREVKPYNPCLLRMMRTAMFIRIVSWQHKPQYLALYSLFW